jgi:hypothetical protein
VHAARHDENCGYANSVDNGAPTTKLDFGDETMAKIHSGMSPNGIFAAAFGWKPS